MISRCFLGKPSFLVWRGWNIARLIFAWETYIIITATPPFIGNLERVPHYFLPYLGKIQFTMQANLFSNCDKYFLQLGHINLQLRNITTIHRRPWTCATMNSLISAHSCILRYLRYSEIFWETSIANLERWATFSHNSIVNSWHTINGPPLHVCSYNHRWICTIETKALKNCSLYQYIDWPPGHNATLCY